MSEICQEQSELIGHVSWNRILGDYYEKTSMQLDSYKSSSETKWDDKGVPLLDYNRVLKKRWLIDHHIDYGVHYNPVHISWYGLANWCRFLETKDLEFRSRFLSQANWLKDNLKVLSAESGVWVYDVEFPCFNLHPSWISAMAQGMGISVLLRAYQLTNDADYLIAAQRAFGAFHRDIRDGGVTTHDVEGNVWFEEYPNDPPSRVLNGFIYALFGVLDMVRSTGDEDAKACWQNGIRTLKLNLHRYERNWWSCYDLFRRARASNIYHRTHIMQLRILGTLTEESIFNQYANRWQLYLDGKHRVKRVVMRYICGLPKRVAALRRTRIVGICVKV